ncbi:MAG: glycosyltransferase family 2 protein [Elusimicrobiota bacterium]|jgi:GT2 family glycosyltransferase|nr:glycosyltransferase family 2 protein [Elusimicrobiota bacterium]
MNELKSKTNIIISVIIPSFNGKHHLKDCLPSVISACRQSPVATEIIVVDDKSSDDTVLFLKENFEKEIKVFENPQKGACSARNHGVAQSKGNILLFVDNDVFLYDDFFKNALPYLSSDMFCAACAGYKAFPKVEGAKEQLDGIKTLQWKRGFLRFTGNIYNKDLKSYNDYLSYGVQGAYFFCSREKFDKLGGFDTLFDPYLLEETDLIYRGLKRGWPITYIKDVCPRHKCGGTIKSKTNKYAKYLSKRNRELFIWKNVTDKKLLFSHILWIFKSISAIPYVLKNYVEIRNKKREQMQFIKKTDIQILKECKDYIQRIKKEL